MFTIAHWSETKLLSQTFTWKTCVIKKKSVVYLCFGWARCQGKRSTLIDYCNLFHKRGVSLSFFWTKLHVLMLWVDLMPILRYRSSITLKSTFMTCETHRRQSSLKRFIVWNKNMGRNCAQTEWLHKKPTNPRKVRLPAELSSKTYFTMKSCNI